MKPIIKYSGGKSKELDKIIKYVPQFNGTYFEPFFGGGALFFYLEPHLSIINDINAKLMNFYSSIRDDYNNIRKELDEIENLYEENSANFEVKIKDCDDRIISENEKLYYDIRDMFNGKKEKKYCDIATKRIEELINL